MLIITDRGGLIQSAHTAYINYRPEPVSPSLPPDTVPSYGVLCMMSCGTWLTIAHSVTKDEARYIRRHLHQALLVGLAEWTVAKALSDLAEGKYFAKDSDTSTNDSEEGDNLK